MKIFKNSIIISLISYFLLTPIFPILSVFVEAVVPPPLEYDFRLESITEPINGSPNQTIVLDVEIENIGAIHWYKDTGDVTDQIQLSYKLTDGVDESEGIRTDLLLDVQGIAETPDNFTDTLQTLNVKLPADSGDYVLSMFLYNVDTDEYIESTIPTAFPVIVSDADTTSPSGNITLNSGIPYTLVNELEIIIEGEDPVVAFQDHSDDVEYRFGRSNDLLLIEYEPLVLDINDQFIANIDFADGFGTYNYFLQFIDGAGNESEIYAASTDYLEFYIDGFISIDEGVTFDNGNGKEVLDTSITLTISGHGDNKLTDFAVRLDNNFLDDDWVLIDTPVNDFSITIDDELSEQTGEQTVYLKFRDEQGYVSESYSDTVYLEYYDITTEFESDINGVLYGGKSDYSITFRNTGNDIAYNIGLQVVLPIGFEYISPFEYKEGLRVDGSGLEPTFSSTNDLGNQVLDFKSIADLLPGESTSVNFLMSIGGVNEGYNLGDIATIQVNGESYRDKNFELPYSSDWTQNLELLPFEITLNSSEYNTGEVLIAEELQNTITLQTNPDIPSFESSEPPEDPPVGLFSIEYMLGDGVKFIDGTDQVLNYLGDVANDIEFFVNDIEGINGMLKWVFNEQIGTEYYATPMQLLFDTIIPKFNEDTQNYVEHNDLITNTATVTGSYVDQTDPEGLVSIEYTDLDTDTLRAKYFDVDKSGVAHNTDAGETIRFNRQNALVKTLD